MGKFLQHIFFIKCWNRPLTQKCDPAEVEEFLQHQPQIQIHTVWQFPNANSMALYGACGVESGRAQEMAGSDSVSQSGGTFPPPLKLHSTSQTSGFHTTGCFFELEILRQNRSFPLCSDILH